MARFKPYDPRQHSLLVINYQDQLQPGTFEHAIHYLQEHRRYDNAETDEEMDQAIRHGKMILSLDRAMEKIDTFLTFFAYPCRLCCTTL